MPRTDCLYPRETDPALIEYEDVWAPGPVWKDVEKKIPCSHRGSNNEL